MSASPRLEDLVALNQELAALIRAGIPLELGLKQQSASWPSRFAALADRISQRLSLGQSLVDALRQEGPVISPAYAAVVEAGLQSGRLPEALEHLANLGLKVQEIRRRICLAAIYPLIVCCLAYLLFLGFIIICVPIWTQTREAMMLPSRWLFNVLDGLHATVTIWGPLVPLGVVLGLAARMIYENLIASPGAWRQVRGSLWIPGVGVLYRQLMRAQFARLLAVLVEHDIPAGQAIMLAAETTGDYRLRDAAGQIALDLHEGATWGEAVTRARGLPEFLQWMMTVGEKQGELPAVLRQTADTYQRQAERWQWWLQKVLPVLLVSLISGAIVLVYCVGLFVPMQLFWYDLMRANP
jgi:type II secretory pathway component PulF